MRLHRYPVELTGALISGIYSFLRITNILLADPKLPSKKPDPLEPGITLEEAQQKIDSWITSIGVRYFSPLTNLAQLVEEVGELARIMSRNFGEQSFKAGENDSDLSDEIADILFVLICIANQTGVDLTSAFTKNIEKKTTRDSHRHLDNEKLKDASHE